MLVTCALSLALLGVLTLPPPLLELAAENEQAVAPLLRRAQLGVQLLALPASSFFLFLATGHEGAV
jgi:hypothetical protein